MDQASTRNVFKFYFTKRFQAGKEDEAKEILTENFRKQDEGTFTQEDIAQFVPKMLSLLNPDKIEEVQAIAKQFAGSFGNK